MSPTIISDEAFRWTLTALTAAASMWALYDVVLLAKLRRSDPAFADKRFGYWSGIVIGLFAISGLLRYHDVF